ncbi:MAG: outer membrane beta-barrel protein [Bacteroidales bacterium]|jgi:opacity protein-like surface antigen|nr:porin family protein [Bacteroidales bacterium]NPV36827.1 outer membrane beta-barrel protein [Bacteroidales bacterium]
MKKKQFQLSILMMGFLFMTGVARSQSNDSLSSPLLRNWRIDIHAGSLFYYGDVVVIKGAQYPIPYPRDWRLGYGLTVTNQITPNWGVRGRLINGKYAGRRDMGSTYYSMEAKLLETSIQTTYDLSSFIRNATEEYDYRIYGIAGLGLMNYRADLYDYRNNLYIRSEGNGNGSGINGRTLQGDISLGVGMDINLADNLKLSLESTYMGTGSDKLDAFVGSTNKNDVLQYTSIGVGYNFDIKKYRSGKKTSSNEASTSWKARKMTETAAKTQKAEKETQQTEAKEKKGSIVSEKVNEGSSAIDAICWAPEQVYGNEEFILSIELNKADLQGKAEVKLLLPDKYSAPEQDIEGAVFVTAGRNITIYYSQLPSESRVPLKIKIKPENPSQGNQSVYVIGKISASDGKSYKFSTVGSFKQVSPR